MGLQCFNRQEVNSKLELVDFVIFCYISYLFIMDLWPIPESFPDYSNLKKVSIENQPFFCGSLPNFAELAMESAMKSANSESAF